MSDQNGKVYQAAREAIKAGDRARARRLLELAAKKDPADHRVWLWLAGLAPSPRTSLAYIQRAEALRPGDATIAKARRWAEERLQRADEAGVQAVGWRGAFVHGDLYMSLIASMIVLGLVAMAPTIWPLAPLRVFLGLLMVSVLPGYALQAAIFPRRAGLDGPERLALSIGLSLAAISVLALILDRLPWGLRLWPILAAETAFIAAASLAAALRRSRIPPSERFRPELSLHLKGWWAGQDTTGRLLSGLLAGMLLIMVASAAAISLTPQPGDQFTEFYLLGPEGLGENYPQEAKVGEELQVTAGLINREGGTRIYRVEVWVEDAWGDRRELAGESDYLRLEPGEQLEWPISWHIPWAGVDQQVDFLLFVDGQEEPYRRLQLILDVEEGKIGG